MPYGLITEIVDRVNLIWHLNWYKGNRFNLNMGSLKRKFSSKPYWFKYQRRQFLLTKRELIDPWLKGKEKPSWKIVAVILNRYWNVWMIFFGINERQFSPFQTNSTNIAVIEKSIPGIQSACWQRGHRTWRSWTGKRSKR